MHQKALLYYHSNDCHKPNYHPILFPVQQLRIMYKSKPVVTNIANALQENERKSIREEYLAGRMNIHPSTIDHIDQYALGRVFQKNKSQSAFYAKIIHKELNTMEVNHKWNLGSDICPLCNKKKEDWLHTLQCTATAQISIATCV